MLGAFLEQYRLAASGPLENVDGESLKKEIREFAEGVAAHNPEETVDSVERRMTELASRPDVKSKIDKILRKALNEKFSECVALHLDGLEALEKGELIEEALERVRIAAKREHFPAGYLDEKISELRDRLTKELRSLPNQWNILKRDLEKREPELYSIIQEIASERDVERFLDAAIQIPGILRNSVVPDAATEAVVTIGGIGPRAPEGPRESDRSRRADRRAFARTARPAASGDGDRPGPARRGPFRPLRAADSGGVSRECHPASLVRPKVRGRGGDGTRSARIELQ